MALLRVFKLHVQVAIQFSNKLDLVYDNMGDKLLLNFDAKFQR